MPSSRVLRNTCALLSTTLLFSAVVAAASVALRLPAPRLLPTLGGVLFAGMVIALIAGLVAVFLQMPALGLAVAAMVALLPAGTTIDARLRGQSGDVRLAQAYDPDRNDHQSPMRPGS